MRLQTIAKLGRLSLASTLIAASLSGCVTVKSVSASRVPESSQRTHPVHASSSALILFWIPFGSSYVETAAAELSHTCRGGRVEGVLSKEENVNYFFSLVMLRRVELQGYCLAMR